MAESKQKFFMSNLIGVIGFADIEVHLYQERKSYFWKSVTSDEEENVNSIQLFGKPFYTVQDLFNSANFQLDSLVKRIYKFETYVRS